MSPIKEQHSMLAATLGLKALKFLKMLIHSKILKEIK